MSQAGPTEEVFIQGQVTEHGQSRQVKFPREAVPNMLLKIEFIGVTTVSTIASASNLKLKAQAERESC